MGDGAPSSIWLVTEQRFSLLLGILGWYVVAARSFSKFFRRRPFDAQNALLFRW